MAGLKTYRAKRRFGVTAEPRGKASRKRGHAYVIQKHDATRLHYDLRLELDGVMKSWAVTRGPSLVPGDKRLAVQVEDHPIEYNKFEGTIPEGEYGGGTVMIWDRGSWEPQHDPHRGLEKGHLDFTLDGEKLQGGWHLVRMHRKPGEKRDNWLLIKAHDQAERSARDKDILEEKPLSVVSGRDLDEIAQGNKVWHSNRTAPTKSSSAKAARAKTLRAKAARAKKARGKPAATPQAKRAKRRRTSALQSKSAVKRSKTGSGKGARSAPPDFVEPCLARLSEKAPSAGGWIHEIKFDGYRLQARLDHGRVTLKTRKGLDWTAKFPSIAAAVKKLPADSLLIDGEVVSEGDDGVSSFSLLQQDLKNKRYDRMRFYVFDLLHRDGDDLRALPLEQRKEALAGLLARVAPEGPLRFSESIDEPGPTLVKHACRLGLEGIVSKRRDAPYRSGRGHDWLKTKCSDRQEFVVAGYVPSSADQHAVGAVVLGFYEHDKLHYAGRVGTGFTHKSARELYRKLLPLQTKTSPFGTVPPEERGVRAGRWVTPKLVAEVEFHGWTHTGRIRQASFQGLREDKPANEVVREDKAIAAATKAAAHKTATRRSTPTRARSNADAVSNIKLSHPDRIYWDDVGVTKRDLAEFYASVWKWMKPHVIRRPIALVRCPEGAKGECFFQKHAHGINAEHLHLVPEEGDKIISIDDLDGLISLVQAGVLEIHTRGTTIDDREQGDRIVFDLDPGLGTTWEDVVAAARDVRRHLAALKLTSFLKTSGGKGLHVVVPIKPAPWDRVKEFTRQVATDLSREKPDRYLATATKAKRHNRIFIDYLRNSREATAVAPYSTRARDGAPVSVPITWEELGKIKNAAQFTVLNLTQRLARLRSDPWAKIGKTRQSLPKSGRAR
ncbi:MAG TPA: DNA ligase D [Pseudolabrys sp.]|nr:DNA ligase D [Pseudolabrys sp.]